MCQSPSSEAAMTEAAVSRNLPEHVVVALGSNLGARADALDTALAAIDHTPGLTVTAVSPWCESIAHTPAGVDPTAPRYVNGVALVDSTLDPIETLRAMQRIEQQLGRPADHARWADRTVDLDIICFGSLISDDPALTLPHPRARERVFVLAPWLAIDPDAFLPGEGQVRELLEMCDPAERAALVELRPASAGATS